jgi:hypothetical protein
VAHSLTLDFTDISKTTVNNAVYLDRKRKQLHGMSCSSMYEGMQLRLIYSKHLHALCA